MQIVDIPVSARDRELGERYWARFQRRKRLTVLRQMHWFYRKHHLTEALVRALIYKYEQDAKEFVRTYSPPQK